MQENPTQPEPPKSEPAKTAESQNSPETVEESSSVEALVDPSTPPTAVDSPNWLSPEMRPTLWRGLAVVVFILFVSLVIPLMRPKPVEEPGNGEGNEKTDKAVPAKKESENKSDKPNKPPVDPKAAS